MIEGFKKFIARGNMIDMAVGVVMAVPSPQWLTLLSTM